MGDQVSTLSLYVCGGGEGYFSCHIQPNESMAPLHVATLTELPKNEVSI